MGFNQQNGDFNGIYPQDVRENDDRWIGLLGKILTGNPWVFTIKLIGLSCKSLN